MKFLYFLFQKIQNCSRSKDVGHAAVGLLLLDGVIHVGEPALAAVLPVEVGGHEDAGTALFAGALPAQAVDLAVIVDFVVLEDGQLDLPVLVLLLLGCRVVLLFAFLCSSSESQHQVKG